MRLRLSDFLGQAFRFLKLGVWFGITTGLVEGFGLLIFKHINWQNWGRMVHVSGPILWISPVVDLVVFFAVSLGCALLAQIMGEVRATRVMVFLFSWLAVYDWLTLTRRLWPLSCVVLAIGAAVAFDRWFSSHQDRAIGFWNRSLPWIPALLLLVFVSVEGGNRLREHYAVAHLPAAAPGSPNVLILVVDDLRADHVSAYGYARPTSPFIDHLANQGALFENAFATTSWSLPSHASIVTGRYPYEHGASDIRASWSSLTQPPFNGYTSIGQALARRGYRTGAFSANRVYFTHDSGFDRGFVHFEDYFHTWKDSVLRTLYGQELLRLSRNRFDYLLRKRADVVNRELVKWIDRDRSRPFLAVLNYFDVHGPYGAPDEYKRPAWPLKKPVDNYDAALKFDDDFLASLMSQLEQRNLASNTLVIVTGDHGESLGQHGLEGHSRALYWELLHVPLVIWYPSHVPAGTRIDRPVSLTEIAPTVLSLVTNGANNEFPYPALDQLWNAPSAAANWPFPLSEMARNPYPEATEKLADQIEPTSTTGAMKSLITPQYHLILHENLGAQLYDWAHDQREEKNLAETPGGSTIAVNLSSALRQMMGKSAPAALTENIAAASPFHDGVLDVDPARSGQEHVSDYYRITVAPGSKVTVEVAAQALHPASEMDPVLAIQDAQGTVVKSCRNPGDDHLKAPAVSDPTPEAFDDLCLDDDPRTGVHDPELQFEVPPGTSSPVELYVHVLDWNPGMEKRKNYRLTISGTRAATAGKTNATNVDPVSR